MPRYQQILALRKGELEGCERNFVFYSRYFGTVLIFFYECMLVLLS